jgi:hypothetical protein
MGRTGTYRALSVVFALGVLVVYWHQTEPLRAGGPSLWIVDFLAVSVLVAFVLFVFENFPG